MSSPPDEIRRIGDNVRRARRARRLTLQVVADLMGRSVGWLSEIERGLRPLERRSDIRALADALQVAPGDLLVVELPDIGTELDGIRQLRALLHDTAIDDPPDVPARPMTVLADLTTQMLTQYHRDGDTTNLVQAAPAVLAELHVHAATSNPHQVEALRLIVELTVLTAYAVRCLGHADLAWIVADRARQAATVLDEPTYHGAAWYGRIQAQSSTGQARPLRQVGHAIDRIEAHLTDNPMTWQVYGMLHLTAALGAQVRGADPSSHVAEAAHVAERLGERVDAWQSFGPANVGIWQATLAVEAGQPGQALTIANGVDSSVLGRGRRAALALEKARAHAMTGASHYRETVRHLRDAERLAATRIRHNPLARELVADLLDHDRRTAWGRDLRGLAYRMNLVS